MYTTIDAGDKALHGARFGAGWVPCWTVARNTHAEAAAAQLLDGPRRPALRQDIASARSPRPCSPQITAVGALVQPARHTCHAATQHNTTATQSPPRSPQPSVRHNTTALRLQHEGALIEEQGDFSSTIRKSPWVLIQDFVVGCSLSDICHGQTGEDGVAWAHRTFGAPGVLHAEGLRRLREIGMIIA